MRITKYLLLALLFFFGGYVRSQETCCHRTVGVYIQVPPGISSFVTPQSWYAVFTSRQYGGGPLLDDCPLRIDIIETYADQHGPLDYSFMGKLEKQSADHFFFEMELVDNHHGQIVKEGQISWIVDEKTFDSEAIQKNLRNLAKSFRPLDDILYDYERIPERANILPQEAPIKAGERMTIRVKDICDNKDRPSQSWQRALAKAQKGEILNGTPVADDYRVFEVGNGSIDLTYQAPQECKNQTETITLHNTCIMDPHQTGDLSPDREIASKKIDIVCDRWEGTITYTEQVSGMYMERNTNRSYSMTITATLDLKKADEDLIRYESEDAYIDLNDSLRQTYVGGIQESWNASKQGRIPMKVSLEFALKTDDDPSDISSYNVSFEDWDGNPVTYSYTSKNPLFGQNCQGRSEQTHGALYMLEDMTLERCTYRVNQPLLVGDYSWNDPLGPSVNPEPWDCEDVLGLPVSVPNMLYTKHLEWKIRSLSK